MAETDKDRSMLLQKEMLAEHYRRLEAAPETGEPVVYTFVPGNLTELIRSFDALPVLPEINALQSAMRGKSQGYIAAAEKAGHSEDVCSYVKCDVGMLKAGNVGPTGTRLPKPDLLLLSYTGCYTFMKWFELLREEYQLPDRLPPDPVPGRRDAVAGACARTSTRQIRETLDPGAREGHRPPLRRGPAAREPRPERGRRRTTSWPCSSPRRRRRARSTPTSAPSTTSGRSSPPSAGPTEGAAYYRALREEVEERAARGEGPTTPSGRLDRQKYRLVVEGPPNWTHFREFWKHVRRRGRGRRRVDLLEGRRDLRPRLPPRPGRSARARSPTTAAAATPTATCRRASTCSRSTPRTTTPTGSSSTPSSPATPSRRGSS